MSDPHLPALAEVRSTGLRPRRLRPPTILVRWLVWPAIRAWFYAVIRRSDRLVRDLEEQFERLRQQAEADRATAMAACRQVETLQATLAAFTIDRAFFENTIRTELMAVTNVVDCYRDIVEQNLAAGSRPARATPRMTRVYVHGNCQATAIAGLLREARPDWQIDSFEVSGDRIVEQDGRYRQLVAEADIILSQPVARGYRGRDDLSVEWLRFACRPGCTVATFPSMYFGGQLLGQHSLGFAGVTSGYHDVVLAACAAVGTAVEDHPHRSVLAWVTNGLLDRLAARARIADEGCNLLPMPHFPLLPSVARSLRAGWASEPRWAIPYADRYRLPELLTREEGLRREYVFYSGMDQAELTAALQPPPVQRFLRDAVDAGQIPACLASLHPAGS